MGARLDIYGTPKKLERYKQRIREDPAICDANKRDIHDFFEYCYASGLSNVRVLFYAQRLLPIAKWLSKDFRAASKDDLQKLVSQHIEQNPRFSVWTKQIYKVSLKKFYKWLEGNGEEHPDKVRWIKTNVNNGNKMIPEQLLSSDDVLKIVNSALNPRDRALISVLYESGCRVSELAGLRLKHVVFDEHGAYLIVDGKTGMRRVRLLGSVNNLVTWIENHPFKEKPDSPLWCRLTAKNRGTAMEYGNITRILHKLGQKANVSKPLNPHAYRHARSTQLAKMGLNEAQLCSIMGWTMGSDMANVYIHLSGQDTDDALLKAYGLKKIEDNGEFLKCVKCSKPNEITAKYCKNCGMPLGINAAVEVDEKRAEFEQKIGKLMELIEKNEEVRDVIVRNMGKNKS